MEIKEMELEALEQRKAEIVSETENEGVDLNELLAEMRAINAEIDRRKADEAAREEIRSAVADGAGIVIEERKDEPKMDIEVRNTPEYINAFAEYVKTGEQRAILSENATNGTIAVPAMVYDVVKHAWDEEGIMSLVKKAYIKGNLKVGFEISASGATKHAEGVAVNEETLTLGIVELIPSSIKKWISISDEALDLTGEAFLGYIYAELAHQIAKKAADDLVAKIASASTESTTTAVGVPAITETTLAVGTVAKAIAQLSDEAANPVIVMNKSTWASMKGLQYGASYAVDVFEGLPVVFNSTLKAYSAASSGDVYMIVGDFGQGALANFPNGEEITVKVDELTLAANDLVRFIGREFVAVEPVAPAAFVNVVMGSAQA